jgi:hypothetical protein
MGRYIVSQTNITPTAGNDIVTIVSAASRRLRVVQVSISGRGSSSAAQQIQVGRSTGGTTPGGAITPGKADHVDQAAAAFTAPTTWAAQPTLDTNTAKQLGWNALGGANHWNPPKGQMLEARNGEEISIRASAGVTFQAMSVDVVVEED